MINLKKISSLAKKERIKIKKSPMQGLSREGNVRFWDIMALPWSEENSETVGELACRRLNEMFREGQSGEAYLGISVDMYFKVPDHEIQKEELPQWFDLQHSNLVMVSYGEEISSFQHLIKVSHEQMYEYCDAHGIENWHTRTKKHLADRKEKASQQSL